MNPLQMRPYQLLCLICRAGGNRGSGAAPARLRAVLRVLHADPMTPVTLRCNVSSHYDYQNPGTAEDTPEGAEFNVRRDVTVLQRLGLVPGDTRPAWELLNRLLAVMPTVAGVCGDAAGGCAAAGAGHYERGVAAGIGALLPPRPAAEMAAVKTTSAARVLDADLMELRPHHLLCMACFHGGRAELAPIAEDNLYEAVVAVQRRPELPIRLVQGPCMICPPCPHYDPAGRRCIRNNAMALRDEKKDLDVLHALGLHYGDVLPARTLFTRLFATITSTTHICGHGDGQERGPEWTVCGGPDGHDGYRQARAMGLGIPGCEDPSR